MPLKFKLLDSLQFFLFFRFRPNDDRDTKPIKTRKMGEAFEFWENRPGPPRSEYSLAKLGWTALPRNGMGCGGAPGDLRRRLVPHNRICPGKSQKILITVVFKLLLRSSISIFFPLELGFLKPVVNTPPGVLLGNLIGIPRKRIHIRKSGQLLLYLTVNGARSIRACPKKWAFHTGKSPSLSRCICILDPEKFHNPPPKRRRL